MDSANLRDHHNHHQQQHQLEEQFVGCSFAAESGRGVSIPHQSSPSMTWNTENSKGLWTKRDSSISPISKTSLIQDFGLCDQQHAHDDLRESHWLSSFSSAHDHQLHSKDQISPARLGGAALSSNSYNFSHVFPSTNISNPDLPLLLATSSLGMSFQALDPSISRDGGKRFCLQSLNGNFGFMKEEESSVSPSSNSNKASPATRNEVTGVKRFGCFSEPKVYSQEPAKKPRNVAKLSSAAPFKVRKEKLGDKVAALHRLVAPFGKTDTASVLTEVIEYIQFLQYQIRTLSLMYMKSTPTKPFTTILLQGSSMENEKGEMKQDLRSKGLCLVPVSFMSYMSSFTTTSEETSI